MHVALLSTFADDGGLDVLKTKRLVDDLIDRGVHGCVANASTGQFATLTVEERRAGLAAVMDAAAGRVPITAQVGAMTTAEAVAGASTRGSSAPRRSWRSRPTTMPSTA